MSRCSIMIFSAIAILLCLTGCIRFTPAVGPDAAPQPESGYIYGRFVLYEELSAPLPAKMGLVLQEQQTNATYTIKFTPLDAPSVIAVKPGTYVLKQLGGKALGASPLTQPFVVDAGKAYYIADFAVQSSEAWLPGIVYAYSWKVDAIRDNYEGTTAEFLAKFPRLSRLPTARVVEPLAAALLLTQQAGPLYRHGRYAEAEPLLKRALEIRETAVGPDHPIIVLSLDDLAVVYQAQRRYAEAEPLLKRALAIQETALGPAHPKVAMSLNRLAFLYYSQGQYAQAEALLKRALASQETALGPAHPDMAVTLDHLVSLYYAQGQYATAEPLGRQALAMRETALGPDHPEVAKSLGGLALLYSVQGQYATAEPLYKRSLAIREKALGPEHPEVAVVLENLATLYEAMGKPQEAQQFSRRAEQIRQPRR